jgi:hypothetical protein
MIALIATLLCAGSPGAGWLSLRCSYCATRCPMLAKRLRCHEGRSAFGPNCNAPGRARLASCAHSSDAAPGVAWLAVLPAFSEFESLFPSPGLFIAADSLPPGDSPAPPTDPPRIRFVG